MFEKIPCPYCGEECISFGMRIKAHNIWTYPECPQCGATLRTEKRYLIIRRVILAAVIISFVILTLCTDTNMHIRGWRMVPLVIMAAADIVIASLAKLDYEDDWKHPRQQGEQEKDQ